MLNDKVSFEGYKLGHDYFVYLKPIKQIQTLLHKILSYRRSHNECIKPKSDRSSYRRSEMIRFLFICTTNLGTFKGNVVGFEQNFVDYLSKRRAIYSNKDFKYGNYHYLKNDVAKVLNRLFNFYGCGTKSYSNVIKISYDDLYNAAQNQQR